MNKLSSVDGILSPLRPQLCKEGTPPNIPKYPWEGQENPYRAGGEGTITSEICFCNQLSPRAGKRLRKSPGEEFPGVEFLPARGDSAPGA